MGWWEGGLALGQRCLYQTGHGFAEGGCEMPVEDVERAPSEQELTFVRLFSESTSRFLVEVRPGQAAAFTKLFESLPLLKIGRTVKESRLRIAGANGEWVIWAGLEELKEAWQRPLRS